MFVAVEQLWKQTIDLFTPWLQPLESNGTLTPWILNDAGKATQMLSVWVSTVAHLQAAFDGK